MKLKFTKMHGCGNDYVYFDCIRNSELEDTSQLSVRLSDRHFGIGSDGIILICKSDVADAKMRMFNNDGSEGKMCGNGIRCVGKFLFDNDIARKETITVETLSGIKTLKIDSQDNKHADLITVNMGKAIFTPEKIPLKLSNNFNGEKIINYPVIIDNIEHKINCVSMGNPHCVVFCDEIDNLNLEKIGPKFERFEIFPEKVNTEFVKIINDKEISMRVFERGSGETFACGTGACASVVEAVENGFCKKNTDILVHLKGGNLNIKYTDEAVFLKGPATTVFKGEIEI